MKGLSSTLLQWVALAAATLLMSGPLVWMVLTSLKPPEQLVADPHALLPERWRWQNYTDALAALPFARYLLNTLILCVGSVCGTVLSCAMVAYAFAHLRWPGRDLAFAVLMATMLLPWQATMIPRFLLMRELGLYGSLAALIVPTFLGEAFYIFLLRQFFLSISRDLLDAARLDGCSEWRVFWSVVMPLSTPALATVALFQFIAVWNDFGGPLLYLNDPDSFPLAYALEQFVSAHSSETHLLLAASVMFALPLIVVFLMAQRTYLRSLQSGAMKE